MTEEGRERLEFLDLEFSKGKYGGTIDHIEIACFHKEKDKYKHYFHLEKGSQSNIHNLAYQLNCVADLCYLNTRNFSSFKESYDIRTQSFLSLYNKNKDKIFAIDKQLEILLDLERKNTIKKQLSNLDSKIDSLISASQKSYLNRLPTKQDLENFLLKVDQEPKKIEQETVQLAKELSNKVKTLEENINRLELLLKKVDFKLSTMLGEQ